MEKTDVEILAEIRNQLLPLVETKDNICGDMVNCCASSTECVLCLVEQIKKQYLNKN